MVGNSEGETAGISYDCVRKESVHDESDLRLLLLLAMLSWHVAVGERTTK